MTQSSSGEDIAIAEDEAIVTECHPLEPFLPAKARLLMLGSFPPPRKRWSIDFFYPNMQNDMWRIFGLVFFNDSDHFIVKGERRFDKAALVDFLTDLGVALYDTARCVRRLQANASDRFLMIVKPTDVDELLRSLPHCRAIATTGQKATDTLCVHFNVACPPVGGSISFTFEGRELRLYRMPSSSRAYPLALEKKAEVYRRMLEVVFSKSAIQHYIK